jgi:sulfonate transport system substrate-binding protein
MRRQAKTFNELGVIPKDVSGQIDTVWDAELLKEVM